MSIASTAGASGAWKTRDGLDRSVSFVCKPSDYGVYTSGCGITWAGPPTAGALKVGTGVITVGEE
jgi:hypothetical protein